MEFKRESNLWNNIDIYLLVEDQVFYETEKNRVALICFRHEEGFWHVFKAITDVGGQGQRKSKPLCLVLVRPDKQTADRVFSRNPDKTWTADRIETDIVRTDRHRKAFFLKIRTESRQLTKSRQKGPGQTDTRQLVF